MSWSPRSHGTTADAPSGQPKLTAGRATPDVQPSTALPRLPTATRARHRAPGGGLDDLVGKHGTGPFESASSAFGREEDVSPAPVLQGHALAFPGLEVVVTRDRTVDRKQRT